MLRLTPGESGHQGEVPGAWEGAKVDGGRQYQVTATLHVHSEGGLRKVRIQAKGQTPLLRAGPVLATGAQPSAEPHRR